MASARALSKEKSKSATASSRDLCDGPSTYRAEKVDQVVDSILSGIFFRAKGVKESELLKRQITSTTTAYQKQLKAVKAE